MYQWSSMSDAARTVADAIDGTRHCRYRIGEGGQQVASLVEEAWRYAGAESAKAGAAGVRIQQHAEQIGHHLAGIAAGLDAVRDERKAAISAVTEADTQRAVQRQRLTA